MTLPDITFGDKKLLYIKALSSGMYGKTYLYKNKENYDNRNAELFAIKLFFPISGSEKSFKLEVHNMNLIFKKLNGCHPNIICYEGYVEIFNNDKNYSKFYNDIVKNYTGINDLVNDTIHGIITKYIDAEQLTIFKKDLENPYSESIVLDFIYQMLDILKILDDQNIIHKDISPENILYDGKYYYLIDFGLACIPDSGSNICLINRAGRNDFIPDKLYNINDTSKFSYYKFQDIYATFVTLYVMVNNTRIPFRKNDYSTYIPSESGVFIIDNILDYFFNIYVNLDYKTIVEMITIQKIREWLDTLSITSDYRRNQGQMSNSTIPPLDVWVLFKEFSKLRTDVNKLQTSIEGLYNESYEWHYIKNDLDIIMQNLLLR